MKQFECEICGGHDVMKSEGIFICQSCGCKYSAEELKDMITDGVEVNAVSANNKMTDETANILKNADNTFADGNYKEAFDLYSRVINDDPDNPHATFYRAISSAWQTSVNTAGSKLSEVSSASERALKKQYELVGNTEQYYSFCEKALDTLDPLLGGMTNLFITYYNKAMPHTGLSISLAIATAGLKNEVASTMKLGILSTYSTAKTFLNSVFDPIEDYSVVPDSFVDKANQFINNFITRFNNAGMSSETISVDELEKIREKIFLAKNPDFSEDNIIARKNILKEKITDLSNNKTILNINEHEKRISDLNAEISGLGRFQKKQKEELESRIDNEKSIISDLKKSDDARSIIAELKETEADMNLVDIALAKVGDTVRFGDYLQTSSTVKTPVEWYVINNQGGRKLLMSKHILDISPFADSLSAAKASFKDTAVHKLLQEKFYDCAFDDRGKQLLVKQDSGEYVSIMSNDNFEKLDDRYKDAVVTELVKSVSKNRYLKYKINGVDYAHQWVRKGTAGSSWYSCYYYGYSKLQGVSSESVVRNMMGVRPCICIDKGKLYSEILKK